VSGGTGFIGRWLLVELTRREQTARAARDRLQRILDTIDVPVVVVAGERDPLLTATRHPVTVVPGAGHDITNLLRDVTMSAFPTNSSPPAATR